MKEKKWSQTKFFRLRRQKEDRDRERERERKWKGDEGQTLWVSAQSSGIKYYVWYLMLKMNQGEAKGHRRS